MPVSIVGLASAVPEYRATPNDFDAWARRFAKPSPSLDKTLALNHRTGITSRPFLFDLSSPLICQPAPPTIDQICAAFLESGLDLAITAAKSAIADWGRPIDEITHLVCTTGTSTHHPGYDLYLHQRLGLKPSVQRILLHGIGCAGGLSLVRVARDLCFSAQAQGRKARVLLVSLEVVSSIQRSQLLVLDEEDEKSMGKPKPNVGTLIFSDGSSAMVIASEGLEPNERASFEVLECVQETVPDTATALSLPACTTGLKAVLSPLLPTVTANAAPSLFTRLFTLLPSNPFVLRGFVTEAKPSAFDWFIHPGGAAIISALEKTLDLAGPAEDPTQTTPAWDIWRERGNSSSAAIGGVIERGRALGGREFVMSLAFGPGVTVEMALLRRTGWKGRAANEQREKVDRLGPRTA